MKAIIRNRYGPPECLHIEERPRPEPGKGELLVRVQATTVNRTDCGILTGTPFPVRLFTGLLKPASPTPGTDFAGRVVGTGPDVTRFGVGDRICGFNDQGLGSHAQYLCVPEDAPLAPIPDRLPYEQAAASMEGAHYALNFLKKGDIGSGDPILLNGASGAIGSALLQLLVREGAEVTAVTDNRNIGLVRSLGARRVISYEEEDFTRNGGTYRCLFDAVGKSSFGAVRHLLTPDGVYISSELGPGNENVYLPLLTKLRGGQQVRFPFPADIQKSLDHVSGLMKKGDFRPVIDRTYPMENIREAYRYVLSGQKTGNVIVYYGPGV